MSFFILGLYKTSVSPLDHDTSVSPLDHDQRDVGSICKNNGV
jgi:hypothetical protein